MTRVERPGNPGEPLFKDLSELCADAARLAIADRILDRVLNGRRPGLFETPIDLIEEDRRESLQWVNGMVVNPGIYLIPRPIRSVLAWFA